MQILKVIKNNIIENRYHRYTKEKNLILEQYLSLLQKNIIISHDKFKNCAIFIYLTLNSILNIFIATTNLQLSLFQLHYYYISIILYYQLRYFILITISNTFSLKYTININPITYYILYYTNYYNILELIYMLHLFNFIFSILNNNVTIQNVKNKNQSFNFLNQFQVVSFDATHNDFQVPRNIRV